MDPLDDIGALLAADEGVNPSILARALRKREALGELGMAGGEALVPQAQATLSGARRQIDDLNAQRQMVLKRALWQQQRADDAMPDEEMITKAEEIGIPRNLAGSMTKRQLQGLFGSEIQRQRASAARMDAYMSPDAVEERALERESKETTIAEKRASLANRPGQNEAELRKEWTAQAPYKNAQAAIEQFAKVENASADAAGDLSLIFSYMKMLDPGSAVREGEFANAQNAAGIPDRIKAAWNKALAGERLSPEARDRFKSEAASVLESTLQAYEQNAEFYRGIAKERDFKVENVVPPMRRLKKRVPAAPKAAGATGETAPRRPQRTVSGETREWDGTKWVPVKG